MGFLVPFKEKKLKKKGQLFLKVFTTNLSRAGLCRQLQSYFQSSVSVLHS